MMIPGNPHVSRKGPDPSKARLTMILVHGRGASSADILGLADELGTTDVAFVAPDAPGRTWYPHSFLSPIPQNEPGISSGLAVLAGIVSALNHDGVTTDRIGLLGFSQGACLSLEFAARNARRYAAIIGLSGGLIGPPGTPRDYTGSMAGTPVYLGCSDIDAHIPLDRVHESAEVFRQLGASVDERIFAGMGHLVNAEEIGAMKELLSAQP